MELSLKLKSGDDILLKPLRFTDKPDEANLYRFVPVRGGKVYLTAALDENRLVVRSLDPEIDEDTDLLQKKLEELLVILNPSEASLGSEDNEVSDEEDEAPYDPEKIRVDTKPFSLRQIYDMMKSEDIDMSPDFQRHLVWDNLRKSRLIESVLLRIPLPIFYFAQDEDGKISVVDGLQRLTAIREFMDNEFKLNKLEYLQEKCGNKTFTNTANPDDAIPAKYFRWFNMTQITVNVIDPSSPFKLKYDIFRRINTGGLPLNSQEIRNCLSSKLLRSILQEMAQLPSFGWATGYSIKDTRMDAQELALRFILFLRKYDADSTLNNYSGNIESELNGLTEELSKTKSADYSHNILLFDNAMKNAHYLFGEYCFRKIKEEHLIPGTRRQLINKALFVSWAVLLSRYDHDSIKGKNEPGVLINPLATKITSDRDFFDKLTFGTNAKVNHQAAFKAAEQIIKTYIKF